MIVPSEGIKKKHFYEVRLIRGIGKFFNFLRQTTYIPSIRRGGAFPWK